MIRVLGGNAINEAKFTDWHSRIKVLGLKFDVPSRIVATPPDKVIKAQQRVAHAYHADRLSSTEYRSLLGSLATCMRPARVFLQRLRRSERRLTRFVTFE